VLRGKGGFSSDPYTGSDGSVPSRKRKANRTASCEGETARGPVTRLIVCANARGIYEHAPMEMDGSSPGRSDGGLEVPVAASAVAPPGPIPNPVVTRRSAGEYLWGDPQGGEAAAGASDPRSFDRELAPVHF
jgi:hypothetical protein